MTHATFDRRLKALGRKHERMTLGITYRIGRDGLITAHPRRRIAPRFPLRSLLALMLAAFAFKAALFVLLGEQTYGARLALLEQGGTAERAGAWLMQPDPATLAVAAVVDALR